MTTFASATELVSRVPPGSRLGVGGALFTRLPLALLSALIAQRTPRLHYIGWGGGIPLEMLLAAGMVERVTFCFSSLDVFGLGPRFREALERQEVEANEWTALGLIQGLEAAGQNLPWFPLPTPSSTFPAQHRPGPSNDPSIALANRIDVDVAFVHAQRADTDGNLEILGARGLDVAMIGAATTVIATVDKVVPRGRLGAPRGIIIPHAQVTGIAEVHGGAFPTSSLPHYAADYRSLGQIAEDPSCAIDPLIKHRMPLFSSAAAANPDHLIAAIEQAADEIPTDPKRSQASTAELMMSWLANLYEPGAICAAGAVSPLALGSYFLASHTKPITVITTSGGYWDVTARPLLLGLGEVLDFASAPFHTSGEFTYHCLYQNGRVDYEVINVAQVDKFGATNNQRVVSPSGRIIRLPGQGGMADVADMHANFVLYQPRQSSLTMVDKVPVISSQRRLRSAHERAEVGYRPGDSWLITNLAVFQTNSQTGLLEPHSIHPGVDTAAVRAATPFPLGDMPLPITELPNHQVLSTIRDTVDPFSVRELEFITGSERRSALGRLHDIEDSIIHALRA